MRGKDGKLGFGERDTKMIIEKSHAGSHNKENDWDYMTEAGVLERPMEKATNKEILLAYKEIKPRKAVGLSEVCAKLRSVSGDNETGINVIMELCQLVLNRKGMPNE